MSDLKCEFPEGCRLDLFANVVKAKYIARQAKVLEDCICVPLPETPCDVTGPGTVLLAPGRHVVAIDDFKVKVLRTDEILNFNRVRIMIEFDITLFLILDDGRYHCFTMCNNVYEQTIDLCQFDPPLTVDEFRHEVNDSNIVLDNWTFDYEIRGGCHEPGSPCFSPMPPMDCPDSFMGPGPGPGPGPIGQRGTCIYLVVYVDIIDKLVKGHDIIVYGEIDPDLD